VPIFAQKWISEWQRHLRDTFVGIRALICLSAMHIWILTWRIGAYNAKVVAGAQSLVSYASGDDETITGLNIQREPLPSAELNRRATTIDQQCLVGCAVIVMETIDTIAPRAAPATTVDRLLAESIRICPEHSKNAWIDEEGQPAIVKKDAIVCQNVADNLRLIHELAPCTDFVLAVIVFIVPLHAPAVSYTISVDCG